MHMTRSRPWHTRGGIGEVTAQLLLQSTGSGFGFEVPRTRQAFGWSDVCFAGALLAHQWKHSPRGLALGLLRGELGVGRAILGCADRSPGDPAQLRHGALKPCVVR